MRFHQEPYRHMLTCKTKYEYNAVSDELSPIPSTMAGRPLSDHGRPTISPLNPGSWSSAWLASAASGDWGASDDDMAMAGDGAGAGAGAGAIA